MHVNNGSNSHQELKDFVYITYSTVQTLKNTKAVYITLLYEILPCSRCLYGDIPWNSILTEFSADGQFFVFGVTLLSALRTADAFPVVASLPPKDREATTVNASAVRRLLCCR